MTLTNLLRSSPSAMPSKLAGDARCAGLPIGLVQIVLRAALALIWCGTATLLALAGVGHLYVVSDYFLRQDVWIIFGSASFLALLSRPYNYRYFSGASYWLSHHPRIVCWSAIVLVSAITLAGTWFIHLDYLYNRDELMAQFDAQFFARRLWMAPTPAQWREFVPALFPLYLTPIVENAALSSNYLPGNAAFRAAIGALAQAEIANPLMVAMSVAATWSIARRLWPDRIEAAIVAVLLLATSTQVLFMAMTSFANPGHLALNLIWLRLFLRSDKLGYAGCLLVGFVACGWHQLAFHAVFVTPFVIHLLFNRDFKSGSVFAVGYALIALFWISYWQIATAMAGVVLGGTAVAGVQSFGAKIIALASNFTVSGLIMMWFNLLRFIAWENPLMIPLAASVFVVRERLPDPLRVAAWGILLTLGLCVVVMPYQGHGWGYRYLHGYIGILCLWAAFAFIEWFPAAGANRASGWSALIAACAFVLYFQLPFQAVQARALLAPRVAASKVIAASKADIVVVDPTGLFDAEDLVRNNPFLTNRPLTMDMSRLDVALIAHLCGEGRRIEIFGRGQDAAEPLIGDDLLTPAKVNDVALNKVRVQALPCFAEMQSNKR